MYVRLKGLDSLSYKLASNNNFIEAKKVKSKYIGSLQEPQKKTTSCKKSTKMSLKYKENTKLCTS